MPQIDIRSTVLTAAIIIGIAAVIVLILGINQLIKSRGLPFFRKRHDRVVRGWRLILLAIILVPVAWLILNYSEPVVYQFYSPSPTVTQTPTITITPSITISPSITLTPSNTDTPSITSTPSMPVEIEEEFEAEVSPNPNAVFSLLQFSQRITEELQPIEPALEFENPVGHLFGTFSYNNMTDGSQWSALWYRDGELVYYESKPWEGSSGGYGYTDWDPPSNQWQPGIYEVQIFVGTEWKVSSYFTVIGQPPIPTIPNTPTRTVPPTRTQTQTVPATPTQTRWPTRTPTITLTPTVTITRRSTQE